MQPLKVTTWTLEYDVSMLFCMTCRQKCAKYSYFIKNHKNAYCF